MSTASGGTRVLIADAAGVRFARTFPAGTDTTIVRTGPLPHLLPLLQIAQSRVPHLLVLTDRAGADLVAYVDESVASGSVSTDAWPLHKADAGGYGTYRAQQTVEQDWKTNAKAVADQVESVAKAYGIDLVFVAGDVHAVGLLREALPHRELREVPGSRQPDGSTDETAQAVNDALGAYVLEQTDRRLEELGTYLGRGEKTAAADDEAIKGVAGVGATVEALQKAQVGTLLLSEGLSGEPLHYGSEGTAIALSPHDLGQLGVDVSGSARQDDVLVRAALLTGADVRVVPATHPSAPPDGVGALLRFPVGG